MIAALIRLSVRFRLVVLLGAAALFTFERRAPFTWKLVQIRLPEPAE